MLFSVSTIFMVFCYASFVQVKMVCRVKIIDRKALAGSNHYLYEKLGHVIGDYDKDDVLTIRGRKIPSYENKPAKNGIAFAHSAKQSNSPFLRIFLKKTISQQNPKRMKQAQIIVAMRNANMKEESLYTKHVFKEAMYSLQSDNIYQIAGDVIGYNITINDKTEYFARPYLSEAFKNWKIGYVIGKANMYKEISICPKQINTSIVNSGHHNIDTCKQYRNCEENIYNEQYIGSVKKLTCYANGLPPMKISWAFKGQKISTNSKYTVSSYHYKTITIRVSLLEFKLEYATIGTYICTATNTNNNLINSTSYYDVSGEIPLYTYISEPKNKIVYEGDSAYFTCNIHQWPPESETITWRTFDGKTRPLKMKYEKNKADEAKETVLLMFDNAFMSDGGVFVCGDDIASLFVEKRIAEPMVTFGTSDSKTIFSCTSSSNPPADVQLELFYDEYNNKNRISMKEQLPTRSQFAFTRSWTLPDHQKYHRVRFKCSASQQLMNRTKYLSFSEGHAMFKYKPIRVTIDTGNNHHISHIFYHQNLTIRCKTEGIPSPKYLILLKDDQIIKLINEIPNYKYVEELQISYSNISNTQNGTYTCISSYEAECFLNNNCKAQMSANTHILVYKQGILKITSPDFTVDVLTSVRNNTNPLIRCIGDGYPPPTIFLKRDNETINNTITKHNSGHTTVQGFVPINKDALVSCQLWQNKFNKPHMVEEKIRIIPVSFQGYSFLYSWNEIQILGVFGGGIFILLTLLTLIWLFCAYTKTIQNKVRSSLSSSSSMAEDDRRRYHRQSLDRASRITEALTEIIEQPFTDSARSSMTKPCSSQPEEVSL